MTTFPNSPRLLKGGLVLIDPAIAAVQRVIVPQYNSDTLTRIRAKVRLGLCVLSVSDLRSEYRGSSIFPAYLQWCKERLAGEVAQTVHAGLWL
jgi:hypothetical protein